MGTEGWCSRCGKQPPAPGAKYCERCAEANRVYRARKAAEVPVGICSTCKVRPNTLGLKQCEPCRVRTRSAMARYRGRSGKPAAYQREYNARRRKEIIEHYGGKCACCGESELGFLELDHVDGGGDAHRRAKGSGAPMGGWIIKNDYPPIFRVLCANCHRGITHLGICPHLRD